jgi:hypothetical protein
VWAEFAHRAVLLAVRWAYSTIVAQGNKLALLTVSATRDAERICLRDFVMSIRYIVGSSAFSQTLQS